MYVGLQLSNAVAVVDTSTHRVLTTIDVGAEAPMALMYVPRAIPAKSTVSAAANLVPAAAAKKAAQALHIELVPASSSSSSSSESDKIAVLSSVTLNPQGPYSDSLEAALTHLQPGQQYVLALTNTKDGSGDIEPIASFVGGPDGAAGVAVLGPFRSMLLRGSSGSSWAKKHSGQVRFLAVAPLHGPGEDSRVGAVVQVQQAAITE
jgi:YVTN family beta-propeller protein